MAARDRSPREPWRTDLEKVSQACEALHGCTERGADLDRRIASSSPAQAEV